MFSNHQHKISMIAAIGKENRVLADENGQIPWHISEDFKYFRSQTENHPIIMGRKTFDSFAKKPLPNRKHIVITRQANYEVPKGVFVTNSIESAIEIAKTEAEKMETDEIFIIGGGEIYSLGMKYADRLYLTLVETSASGTVFFPEYKNEFKKIISSRESSDENYSYEFLVLER